MTVKQKKFADYYIELGNATQAAIKAGYSKKTARAIANETLTKPYVKAYIEERMLLIEKESIASATEIIKYLTSVLRDQQKEETLILCGDGKQQLINKKISAKEKLKAAELLGKRYGLFTDKVSLDIASPIVLTGDDEIES